MQDRQELLDEVKTIKFRGLGAPSLVLAYCIFLGCVLFFVIKIFLVNHIYYSSKEITKLQARYDLLYEENRFLKKELETLRFHYRITNLED
ncbi:hypothetical protein [Helicobacter mustelae]|uniref:Septum formation initiator n=1 Tax=Helicobacter mustelae (strain ATCC 43772 / CCUG 25715 / CIP 103759 / LMG 18044 / NCTC 12198 / R85-136P) TaxID=679897 RepID=D3UGN7_HELM1|nr:hypothetical protein [Helicobacter mustelae]CBG39658.1 Putative hypothetical protein [Helicobacter mustelae 12198]SQH71168.1 Uncharacterised protein [Helicobacter mustelae]STP12296.1 Uncharacterised protein [Helicobacter mustelae]